ncbi:hypothetical protein DRB96_11075 [Streptomyces sp. ICC1]|nr:hypothetical protein DRB89_12040 [Streptomyces sp. ICC4]AWZ12780.1 hypothetical protein DRB96_11075 [Streptomyces sp. ICC1]
MPAPVPPIGPATDVDSIPVHVLRVFTDEEGGFGNPLGVVLHAEGLDSDRRQRIAAELGYSETVFVDDLDRARLQIFTPAVEVPMAGHPLVGISWMLTEVTGRQPEVLRPVHASEVTTWRAADVTWIRARLSDAPPWEHIQSADAAAVEGLPSPAAPEYDATQMSLYADNWAPVLPVAVENGVPPLAPGTGYLDRHDRDRRHRRVRRRLPPPSIPGPAGQVRRRTAAVLAPGHRLNAGRVDRLQGVPDGVAPLRTMRGHPIRPPECRA